MHSIAQELKSSSRSVMDARESLAKRNRRDGYFCDHICADQWPTAEDFAIEPASCCFARGGVGGLDWRDDSRAGLSHGQLRHAGTIIRDDVDHGISLSGASFACLFRGLVRVFGIMRGLAFPSRF